MFWGLLLTALAGLEVSSAAVYRRFDESDTVDADLAFSDIQGFGNDKTNRIYKREAAPGLRPTDQVNFSIPFGPGKRKFDTLPSYKRPLLLIFQYNYLFLINFQDFTTKYLFRRFD
jgi:hypothetical protein